MKTDFIENPLDKFPESIDENARTAEIIISTGAPVPRFDMDGAYLEILEVAGVDASRPSIPLLADHEQTLDAMLGRIIEIRLEVEQVVAVVRFNKTEAGNQAFEAVKSGDYSSSSVGYAVLEHRDKLDPETGQRVRTVTKWELHEVSLVAVPADAAAQVRSLSMANPKKGDAPAPDNTTMVRNATISPTMAPQIAETEANVHQLTRSEVNSEIRALASTFSLGDQWANAMIDTSTPIDQVRAAATQAVTQRAAVTTPPMATVTATNDLSPDQTRSLKAEAIYARANLKHELSEPARQFSSMSLEDHARDALTRANETTIGLSKADIFTRAMHTTSDFPMLLESCANRALRTGYERAPSAMKRLANQVAHPDFRERHKIQVGEAELLKPLGEHGEVTYGTMDEASEGYALDTYAKAFSYTRKAMVNDDLGALVQVPEKLGRAASEFEDTKLVELLISNGGNGPTMGDGVALFDDEHGNVCEEVFGSSGVEALAAMRLQMRRQKSLGGHPINLQPKFILAPPEKEEMVEKMLAEITPSSVSDVNPFAGRFELLIDARLSAKHRVYMACDPAQIDGLEYAYLSGAEGPQIETERGFDIDGMKIKVTLDFGCAFIDWRGWQVTRGE